MVTGRFRQIPARPDIARCPCRGPQACQARVLRTQVTFVVRRGSPDANEPQPTQSGRRSNPATEVVVTMSPCDHHLSRHGYTQLRAPCITVATNPLSTLRPKNADPCISFVYLTTFPLLAASGASPDIEPVSISAPNTIPSWHESPHMSSTTYAVRNNNFRNSECDECSLKLPFWSTLHSIAVNSNSSRCLYSSSRSAQLTVSIPQDCRICYTAPRRLRDSEYTAPQRSPAEPMAKQQSRLIVFATSPIHSDDRNND